MPSVDVLIVSVDTTSGWRTSARELEQALQRCGVSVSLRQTGPVPRVRTFALTDYVQAAASRRVAAEAIERLRPRALIYCSITAALLWPRPGAIWLDAVAAGNRPGRHGIWQRVVERRRLAQAPVVMVMNPGALAPLPAMVSRAIPLPVPVGPSADELPPAQERDIDALAYAGDPAKKRLNLILETWDRARREGETLVVAGAPPPPGPLPAGVRFAGTLPREQYRGLVRRARVFVAAPRVEDHGTAQLEALADGCVLVSTPALGGYPALALARALDPRLVAEDLAPALRTALDDPLPGYAARAEALLEEYSPQAVDRALTQHVLPVLLGAGPAPRAAAGSA